MKKLGQNIAIVGCVIVVMAFMWFLTASGGKPDDNAVQCLYSNPIECQIAWEILGAMGETTYNYLSFWAGVVTTAFGIVLILSDKEKDNVHPNT